MEGTVGALGSQGLCEWFRGTAGHYGRLGGIVEALWGWRALMEPVGGLDAL